jgi:hypothetical protein
VLGCSAGTVAWRIHEARDRLRRALKNAEVRPRSLKEAPPEPLLPALKMI